MKFAFYPGCVAQGAARELKASTEALAKKLGIELVPMPSATCCGAGVITEQNPALSNTLNARTFAIAEKMGLDILNICGTCQGVMKKAQKELKESPKKLEEANKAMDGSGLEYRQKVKIRHLLNVLIEDIGADKLKSMVKRPLKDLRVGAFYGCYALRPGELSGLKDPDNPDEIENLVRALGGEPVDYPGRLRCCGFPYVMMSKRNALTMAGNHISAAKENGANCMVTPCPLCHLNLDPYQPESAKIVGKELNVPILHLPQMVGLALGVSPKELQLSKHIIRFKESLTQSR